MIVLFIIIFLLIMVTYLIIIVDVGAKVRRTIKTVVPPLQIFVSFLQNLLSRLWHSIKKTELAMV